MHNTRIKFCGITRQEDLHYAATLGVDALGFVFCEKSPRNLNVDEASQLLATCPPFISRVGLFMDADASTIKQILSAVHLDLLQFHGRETATFCSSFGKPYIKSVAMGGEHGDHDMYAYSTAEGLLLDSNVAGSPGGTGEAFDWTRIPEADQPVILAGGLDADNVTEAIRIAQPYAVDVSSGIESRKGIKDQEKMKKFVSAVRATNEKS